MGFLLEELLQKKQKKTSKYTPSSFSYFVSQKLFIYLFCIWQSLKKETFAEISSNKKRKEKKTKVFAV